MTLYTSGVRPLLFRLPSDVAHDVAHFGFRWSPPWRLIGRPLRDPRLRMELAGMRIENPVGLAPGFDKNGHLVGALDHLGFGYLVVGSITRRARAGNAKPRMVRYPDSQSLGNNLGLPSVGLDAAVSILRRLPDLQAKVIASVTGFTADELVESARVVEPFVDAVELGLVCPNTEESQRMAELAIFDEVVERVMTRRRKAVFVRLPPHHDESEWNRVRAILDLCLHHGVDGVGTNGRSRVIEPRLPNGTGSISGRATFPDAVRIVEDVARHTRGRIAIRASGGIFDGEQAARMLRSGATTVEVYSALVYRGPRTPVLISQGLLDVIDAEGIDDVAGLRTVPERN